MVVPSIYTNVEVEAEEAVVANPGELQERVEVTNLEAVDLKRMIRSTSSYSLQDTQRLPIIPSKIK